LNRPFWRPASCLLINKQSRVAPPFAADLLQANKLRVVSEE
jgi:hypothetical protein